MELQVEVNRKNVQALMVHVEAIVEKIATLERGLQVNSNAVGTTDRRVDAMNTLIHAALVKTKGAGSTEPDNGD